MKISVAQGEGIGPEVVDATLQVFHKVGVPLQIEPVELRAPGGEGSGVGAISPEARAAVANTGLLLTGPQSAPVRAAAQDAWGAFARKRVYRQLPGVPAPLGLRRLDLTVVVQQSQAPEGVTERLLQDGRVALCQWRVSRASAERVHRYTFAMAARKGAKRVTCAHQADLMPLTDGLFVQAFYEIAREYPQISARDVSLEKLALQLVVDPDVFEAVVVPQLQGGVIGVLAAGLVGGLAYAPSASIGDEVAIFEPAHGPEYELAGTDKANPSSMVLSATMLLRHLGLVEPARRIERALERTLLKMHRAPDLGQPRKPFRTSVFVRTMLEELEGELRGARVFAPTKGASEETRSPLRAYS